MNIRIHSVARPENAPVYRPPTTVRPPQARNPLTLLPRAYRHVAFTQAAQPALALEAWRLQAQGYRRAGFVGAEAIADDGGLAPDIDLSRRPNTTYYMAFNDLDPNDRATLRLNDALEGGSYRDLPAYVHARNALSPFGQALLDDLDRRGIRIREVAALAGDGATAARSVLDVLRHVIHESQDSSDVWLVTTVASTHQFLEGNFGKLNFIVLGDDISIDDARVNPVITLRPSLMQPREFLDNILRCHAIASAPRDKRMLMRGLSFMAEGLEPSQMSPAVSSALDKLGEGHRS
jgi:hypothetical protein